MLRGLLFTITVRQQKTYNIIFVLQDKTSGRQDFVLKDKYDVVFLSLDSWCEWQRAKANGSLDRYKQSYNTLPDNMFRMQSALYMKIFPMNRC